MSKGFRNVFSLVLIAFGMSVSAKAAVLRELQPLPFQWPQAGWRNTGVQVSRNLRFWPALPGRHKNPDDIYNSTVEGRIALISAIFPIASLIAFSLTSFAFFLVPVIVFSVIAVVFGAVGIRRRKPGFAIAGFVLGLIGLVAGFAVLAAL
jgi:hypothetical protein